MAFIESSNAFLITSAIKKDSRLFTVINRYINNNILNITIRVCIFAVFLVTTVIQLRLFTKGLKYLGAAIFSIIMYILNGFFSNFYAYFNEGKMPSKYRIL